MGIQFMVKNNMVRDISLLSGHEIAFREKLRHCTLFIAMCVDRNHQCLVQIPIFFASLMIYFFQK